MDEEEVPLGANDDLDQDSQPDHVSTTDEQVIGPSPAATFVDEVISNATSGDPFRLIQRFARESPEVLQDAQVDPTSRLTNSSPQASRLFNHMAGRLVQSAPILDRQSSLIQPPRSLNTLNERPVEPSGFVSRAGVSEYRSLISQPGEFKGVFFQFQEQSIVSQLAQRRDPWTLLTQRLTYSAIDKPSAQTTGQILAANELTYAVGSLLAKQRGTNNAVLGIQSYASFHPKVGYVGDLNNGLKAFLGTQNVTPALSGNNSLESLLIFNRPASSTTLGQQNELEGRIATEIYQLTNTLTDYASNQNQYLPGGISRQLRANNVARGYLYVESEIYGRITSAISTAAHSPQSQANGDQVVISMGELSLLLKTRGYAQDLLSAVETLARQKRLVIITDNSRLQSFMEELRNVKRNDPTKALTLNEPLIRLLIDSGSIRAAPTGYQHDKSIAIFGGQSRALEFFTVGSANLSADSMVPISQMQTTDEYFHAGLDALKRAFPTQYDPQAPINLDVNVAIGFGRYRDDSRHSNGHNPQADQQVAAYFSKLNQSEQIFSYYNKLAGGQLMQRLDQSNAQHALFETGSATQAVADGTKLEQLRQQLERLNTQIGQDILSIKAEYSLKTGQPVALDVKINAIDAGSPVSLKLTVDRSGNVILADQNKVITGSLFINKSDSTRQALTHNLLPGQSVKLSAVETATALVATLARELSYQSRYGVTQTIFERLQQSRPLELQAAARQLLADSLAATAPELASRVHPAEGRLNLTTATAHFRDTSPSTFSDQLERAKVILASGLLQQNETSPFVTTPAEVERRAQLLTVAFNELLDPTNVQYGLSEDFAAERLLTEVLGKDHQVLADLKRTLVLSTEEGRRQFAQLQATQARRLVSDLAAPFLAAHELGYTAMQAQARLPIYAETTAARAERTSYDRVINAGLLNPAEVKPGTRLGPAGMFFSPVGAMSQAKPLKVPGYGNLRQVSTSDADISAGAAVTYDVETLFQSTPGLALYTPEQLLQHYQQIAQALGRSTHPDQSDQELLANTLYSLPFPKPEQIPQRLKNVVGARPTLDVQQHLIQKARSLTPLTQADLTPDALTSGRLRESLPALQHEELVRVAESFGGDYAQTQSYFRQRELEVTNAEHGILGPRSMKRVGIIGGISLIGDSSYLNAGYEQSVGSMHRMIVKVNSRNLHNQLEVETAIAQALKPGNIVFGSPLPLPDHEAGQALLDQVRTQLQERDMPATEANLQRALAEYDGGRYSHYLIKSDRGGMKLFLKEGLYSQTHDESYRRIGGFTHDGLIALSDTGQFTMTEWGRRRQPITLKFPAFGKRYQEGVSIIASTPNIEVSHSGTIKVTTDVMTAWNPTSGSRPAGQGLVKGPFTVIEQALFDDLQALTNERSKLTPASLQHEKLYGLFGHGHFKGFNYETGIFLLSQEDTRRNLQNLSGTELARSLSLLFIGDESVKRALQQNLHADSLHLQAEALSSLNGSDLSKIKDGKSEGLATTALGLRLLAEHNEHESLHTLEPVKRLVRQALEGVPGAADRLQAQAHKLIQLTVDDPKAAYRFSNGQLSLKESHPLVRGAGLLAHLSFIGQQLFNPLDPFKSSTKRLFERNFADVDRYLNDPAHRTVTDTVAATANFKLPAPTAANRETLKRKLSLLQAKLQHDFVLEELKDITTSRSLVPAGMKDEAALEYQYMLGMSNRYMKAFTRVGGGTEASRQIQQAFSMLVGSARLGLPDPSAKVEYRLALPGEEPGFISAASTDAQRLQLGYTSLAEKLGLLSNAIKGVGVKGPERGSLMRFIKLQRIATNFSGNGETSLQERGILLSRLYGVAYFADDHSPAAKLQTSKLTKQLQLDERYREAIKAHSLTPNEVVANIVHEAYQEFAQDRQVRRQQQLPLMGFGEFVSAQTTDATRVAAKLEHRFALLTQLTQGANRIPGVPLSADKAPLAFERITQQIDRLGQKHLRSIEETLNTSIYKDFVEGSLKLEAHLQAEGLKQNRVHPLLTEIQKTRQLVMPKFEFTPITHGEHEGRFELKLLDPATAEPSVGVLLGTDVLKRVSLLFPQFEDESIRHQVALRQQLLQTQDVRARLASGQPVTISDTERGQLQEFQDTLEYSRVSLMHLLDTDLTRKAMGDRQKFSGAVGTTVGSFALDPHETAVGDRFFNLAQNNRTLNVVNQQFQLIAEHLDDPTRARQMTDSAQTLVHSLGVKLDAPHVLAESFAQFKSTLKRTDLEQLKLKSLSALTGYSEPQTQQLLTHDPEVLTKVLNLPLAAIRRGGAPAGASGLVNDSNYFEVNTVDRVRERVEQAGGGIIPHKDRFSTGMYAPATSQLLSMLGDFDGDAYQFLLTGAPEHASQINALQKEVLQLKRRSRSLTNRVEPLAQQTSLPVDQQHRLTHLEEELYTVNRQLTQKQDELAQRSSQLTEYASHYDRTEAKSLQKMRRWVGSYLALPDFVTNDPTISTGSLLAMVQQMSGTMPQMEDAARFLQDSDHKLTLIHSLFDTQRGGFQFTQEALDQNRVQHYVNHLIPDASEQVRRDELALTLSSVFNHAQQQQVGSVEAFQETAQNYLAFRSNLSMTFEQVNKTLKKASGTVLSPTEFQSLTSLIGQAGSELIGKTYNTLIPLLDQSMFDHALLTGLQTTGQDSLPQHLSASLDRLGQQDPTKLQQIDQLKQALLGEGLKAAQQKLSDRFSGMTGTLGALQQLIRDALKEKSNKGIIKVLSEANFEGKSLGEALDSVEGDPLQQDRQRVQILKQAVSTQIGPNLSTPTALAQTSERLRQGQSLDPGLTGFGALLKLAEFSHTPDEGLYQGFASTPELRTHYEQGVNEGRYASITDFAADQVLSLVERSQASFLASTQSEHGKQLVIDRLRQFGQQPLTSDQPSTYDQHLHTLVQEYETERLQIQSDQNQLASLNDRLIQESTLIEVQRRNREQGTLTLEHIKDLRTFQHETQAIRFGDGDIFSRMATANSDSYNAYTQMLQRGQQPQMQDALYLANYRLDAVSPTELASLSSTDQQRAMRLQGLRAGSSVVPKELQPLLTQALLTPGAEGKTPLQALQQTSAGIVHGVFGLLDEMEALHQSDQPHIDRIDTIKRQIAGLYEQGHLNVERLQTLTAQPSQMSPHLAAAEIERRLNHLIAQPQETEVTPQKKAIFHHDAKLEVLGAFAAPLLLASLGNGVKLDERAALFGLDALQAVASLSSKESQLTGRLLDDPSHQANRNFMYGRTRDSVRSEGFVIGTAQALVQETLYASLSQVSHQIVNKLTGYQPHEKIGAGAGVATVAGEVLSTVLSLSVARAMTKERTPQEQYVPDRLGDMLKSIGDQIWQMVEQAQLAALDTVYEVLDTQENQNIDFELSAIPSELEQNIEQGIVVMDEDNNPLSTEFDSTTAEQAQLVTSAR